MVIWFGCCCFCTLTPKAPNKWEMCVMIEKFPSRVLLLLLDCLLTCRKEPMPPYNFNAGLFYLSCFLHFQRWNDSEICENEGTGEKSFFIYDFFSRWETKEKGELCKVLFYCSLKNHIMLLFMSDKIVILMRKRKLRQLVSGWRPKNMKSLLIPNVVPKFPFLNDFSKVAATEPATVWKPSSRKSCSNLSSNQ